MKPKSKKLGPKKNKGRKTEESWHDPEGLAEIPDIEICWKWNASNNLKVAPLSTNQGQIDVQKTLYKRPLSNKLIGFSSPEGRTLFKTAMLGGYMENYFPLSE